MGALLAGFASLILLAWVVIFVIKLARFLRIDLFGSGRRAVAAAGRRAGRRCSPVDPDSVAPVGPTPPPDPGCVP